MKIEQEGIFTGQETTLKINFRLEEAIFDLKTSFVLSLPTATILYDRDLSRLSEDDKKIVPKLTNRRTALCLYEKSKKQRLCSLETKTLNTDPRFGVPLFPAYASKIVVKDVCDLIECWNTEGIQTLTIK